LNYKERFKIKHFDVLDPKYTFANVKDGVVDVKFVIFDARNDLSRRHF